MTAHPYFSFGTHGPWIGIAFPHGRPKFSDNTAPYYFAINLGLTWLTVGIRFEFRRKA